jgi:hypothetical protein
MKVRRLVEMLYQTYDPEQEIMATWWGSEHFETKAGVWEKAVELFDNSPHILKDMHDFIRDTITDAEIELEKEEDLRLKSEVKPTINDLIRMEEESNA